MRTDHVECALDLLEHLQQSSGKIRRKHRRRVMRAIENQLILHLRGIENDRVAAESL